MALTPIKEQFAEEVARRTGLQLPTVRAWVAIEGGPDDNPLNIARWDPQGRRYFAGFGSTREAVERTVRILQQERYAPILRVARQPQATIRDELWAIIESPWEETNYTLDGVRGARLIGTYASLYPKGGLRNPETGEPLERAELGVATPALAAAGVLARTGGRIFRGLVPRSKKGKAAAAVGAGAVAAGALDEAGDLLGIDALIDSVAQKAALAFLYVVLTAVGVWLIVTGLLRATGTSAGAVGSSVGARLRPAPDDIPF